MKIGIVGCGWLGDRIASHLVSKDHVVVGTTTSIEKTFRKEGFCKVQFSLGGESADLPKELHECDGIIIAFPPSAGKKRVRDYPSMVNQLLEQLHPTIRSIILISSTGVYRGCTGEVNEETPVNDVKNLLLGAEKNCTSHYPKITSTLRCGGLFGDNRIPGKYFADKNLEEDGAALVNYIHFRDICIFIEKIYSKEVQPGRFNLCCPKHPSKKEVYKVASKKGRFEMARFTENGKSLKTHLVNSDKFAEAMGEDLIYHTPLEFDYFTE
ncbi:MAG: nucleoside-diphosphate-sugar epimerase [Sphingobacteriales bacterium]|jgi:nucleoside-diphosphate-sugar epimerase